MSLRQDLYQVESSLKELGKDAKEVQEIAALAGSFLDEEKGLSGNKVASIAENYRPGASIKDEEIDLIDTVENALPGYSKKLQEILEKGISYKNARKTAEKLKKVFSYLGKHIPKILKYIGKKDPGQMYRILQQYKDQKDKAADIHNIKSASLMRYVKK